MHKLLTDHPATVGETYGEHCRSAWGFGLRLLAAGLACCVHGLLPFLCVTTGSRTVTMLHQRMVVERSKRLQKPSAGQTH